jgi:hypothetical protein
VRETERLIPPTEFWIGAINQAGVPAIALLQDARLYFDYHYSAADTVDKVRIEELRKVPETTQVWSVPLPTTIK